MASPQRKRNIISTIIRLVRVGPIFFHMLSSFAGLVEDEAQLAKRSLIVMIVLTISIVILLLTTWLTLFAILYFYLISLQFTAIGSLSIILLINFLLLILMTIIIAKMKYNITFPETRQFIKTLGKND